MGTEFNSSLPDNEHILSYAEVDPIAQRQLLIDSWVARNDLYKQLFGEYEHVSPHHYVPPSPLTREDIEGGANLEGEEMHLAVLAYAPNEQRSYWMYVTAGLCSPWLQQTPEEVSGFGCELMIKAPADAPWAAQILRSMAFYIFNHTGTISPGVQINLNAPIVPNSDSELRNVFVWYADEAPDCWYLLPSGGFGLFCVVGITDDERNYSNSVANNYGTWCIQESLRQTGHGQVSDPDRRSVIQSENAEILNRAKTFAYNFTQASDPL